MSEIPTAKQWSEVAEIIAKNCTKSFCKIAVERDLFFTEPQLEVVFHTMFAVSRATMEQMGYAVLRGVDISNSVSPETIKRQQECEVAK